MRILLICICSVLFTGFTVSGCTVYRINIQQGNIIDEDDLAKIQLGMSKKQVQYILGTPILKDPFHPNRWDYIHSLKPGSGVLHVKSLVLYFKNNKLVKTVNNYHQKEPPVKPDS